MKSEPALILLRPAAGRRVRDEDGALLSPEGVRVAPTVYWQRRILDGDVIAAEDD